MKGKFQFPMDHVGYNPVHFQPTSEFVTSTDFLYEDIHRLSIIYETDMEKLSQYIPQDLELLSNKLFITAVQNGRVAMYGNRPYNLLTVMAAVGYGDMTGVYPLSMWENDPDPVMGGREILGVPKTMANIDNVIKIGDHFYCGAGYYCYNFVRMKAECSTPAPQKMLDDANTGAYNWSFNIKYMPNANGIGPCYAALVAYPEVRHDYKMLLGKGQVEWTIPEDYQYPMQSHIVKAIAELPILSEGTAVYSYRDSIIKCRDTKVLKRYI